MGDVSSLFPCTGWQDLQMGLPGSTCSLFAASVLRSQYFFPQDVRTAGVVMVSYCKDLPRGPKTRIMTSLARVRFGYLAFRYVGDSLGQGWLAKRMHVALEGLRTRGGVGECGVLDEFNEGGGKDGCNYVFAFAIYKGGDGPKYQICTNRDLNRNKCDITRP